ncbi:hypothetical protein Dimus_036490, partial [Dionaea muscipula]
MFATRKEAPLPIVFGMMRAIVGLRLSANAALRPASGGCRHQSRAAVRVPPMQTSFFAVRARRCSRCAEGEVRRGRLCYNRCPCARRCCRAAVTAANILHAAVRALKDAAALPSSSRGCTPSPWHVRVINTKSIRDW